MRKLLLCSALVLLLTPLTPAQNSSPDSWAGASWIWDQPNANHVPQSDEPRYLRRVFELPSKAAKAELRVSVDNQFVVYLNGQKVGAHAEWQRGQKYNVAKFLVPGKNVLAVEAHNHGGVAGAIARLYVRTKDKKELVIGTDNQTRITRTADKDWLKSDFDDARWAFAVVLGDAGLAPWNLAGGKVRRGGSSSTDVSAVDPKIKSRLSAQEQLKHFVFPKGFQLELVAADPLVINPITMTLDEKGRIYVSESHTYRYGPKGSPIKPFANPVIRLDPLPEGGFKRVLVADGFDDPVMGMAIKEGKLWLTANNYLYQYDLPEDGKATKKRTILVEKNKAWNPFGMFVLEWGPDGLLYMSVGNHPINIQGPDGKIGGRKSSGIVMRMNADGTKMERLVHGLRVPYSFEYDPFGQLWLLSNGEGNPNRFVRVIDGVDYHCYSRSGVDNNWLAGNHALAPPCFELMRGANTQLMRYYGAAFPESYQGSLFLDNWGAHGFSGPNRAIFRYVPDAHGKIVTKEPLLSCTDPHFRPSHIALDPDGNLLVADWYGRDDESDMTGRIWRLKYMGKDTPKVTHKLDSPEWTKTEYAISALGSPHHLIRAKAMGELLKHCDNLTVASDLSKYAGTAKEPLGAAHALWTLLRMKTPTAKEGIINGMRNPDPRVRRLTLNLLRRYQLPNLDLATKELRADPDPAVRVEAGLALGKAEEIRTALLEALNAGAAKDEFLRYEAAWHLGKHGDQDTFAKLLTSEDEQVRLAGMIAIDVACYEGFPTKPAALAALGKTLENPGKADVALLLTLAQLDGDASLAPALQKLVSRDDLPVATSAQALLVLKSKSGSAFQSLGGAARKRLIEAVDRGSVRITSPADQLMLFEFLESEGPTAFALRQIAGQIQGGSPTVRPAAHALARRFGPKASRLADPLWPAVLDPRTKNEDAVEMLTTLAHIDAGLSKEKWQKALSHVNPLVRTEAVRWWRTFKGQPDMVHLLAGRSTELVKSDAGLKEDLAAVFRYLEAQSEPVKGVDLPRPETDKGVLGKQTLAFLKTLPAPERKRRALLGRQVFDRAGCVKCHTTATQTTLLAPSLKGIAAQKGDYLVESVLFPSKIIKTGFESQTVVATDGKVYNGLVKDEGKFLRVLNLDRDDRIAKSEVEQRTVQRVSIMPEGQEAQLSRRQFADLIAYLMTLR